MSSRRVVRVTPQFFERLDELFPAERGPDGEPSATDFLLHELPSVIDRLAIDFEGSTIAASSDSTVRVLISAGGLVEFFAVYAVLAVDDSIEIVYLEAERSG